MKPNSRKQRSRERHAAALALALTLAPSASQAAVGDMVTNTASVVSDNADTNIANNVFGVSRLDRVALDTTTNAAVVTADNTDTNPANNGGGNGVLSLPPLDTDGDGIPDYLDLDADNDGIPNSVEDANSASRGGDTDGDGIPDYLDLDSDNDGILDVTEAGHAGLDADHDGRVDGPVGTDGIPDSVQASPNSGTVNYTPKDTDGDGHPDYIDLDSDNDGINDVRESNGTDANGDGQADGTVDGNGIRSTVPAGGAVPPDTDGDGVPDFRDLDSDNDGIPDVVENGGTDPDNNGIVGTGQVPLDTNGDGIPDAADGAPNGYGDTNDPVPLDTDGDGIPNYRDLDSDNDGTSDVIEGGNGAADTNGDGTISPAESGDTDGDGIPNVVDHSPLFGDTGGSAPPNSDADPFPDYLDSDRNNDGISDLIADGHNPALDPNHDGKIDSPADPDHDGIPNNLGNDTRPAGFGGATPVTVPVDTDGDGVPDAIDLDDDNDGIPDTVEDANALNGGDTDGDGIPDRLDLDSDNDGILDYLESGGGGIDANQDGRVDGPVGTDGIPNSVQNSPNSGTVNYTVRDTDGDGRPDYVDLDSDNDGINDVRETRGTDVNGDGMADGAVDANGIPSSVPAGGSILVDQDGDGIPGYRDLDSDNDGIPDVVENGGSDPDHNGIVGTGQVPTDTDQDGIPDAADTAPAVFGDLNDPVMLDSDGDGVPNIRDLDSDNDGTPDVIESGHGGQDTNHNSTIDAADSPDTDGDGIPDSVDHSPLYGDAGGSAPTDTDSDGIPDYLDTDRDNNGTPDLIEDGHNPALDPNNDGRIDSPSDPDGDGIPNNLGNDTAPAAFGSQPDPSFNPDSDGDGIPDYLDKDDDNDGIPDLVEIANARNGGDTDGDGIPDYLDLDSDNDGIPDDVEAGHGALDADHDGRLDGPVSSDGIPDSVQTLPTSGTVNYTLRDQDGDGVPDYLDLDSDNDGILDITEAGHAGLDANKDGRVDGGVGADGIPDAVQAADGGALNYTLRDTDDDGHPDYVDLDSDNDGINDVRESNGSDANGDAQADGTVDADGVRSSVPAGGAVPPDTDGDGVPDFRDLDSDNDGIHDVTENGGYDPDNFGTVGLGAHPIDSNGDGIPDAADTDPNGYGETGDPAPRDSDGDGIPDYRDLDSDNDGTADVVEAGHGALDTDHDGTISPAESGDTDGDGIPNTVDVTPTVWGDEGSVPPPNSDGDLIPDYLDTDRDNDSVPDLIADGHNPALDADHDGRIDSPSDPDHDGIPNNLGNDTKPAVFGGVTPVTVPLDTDGDGVPDAADLDSDNDGIPDTVENANALNGGDTDGDGIPDYLDLDSDNDGILDVVEAGHSGVDADHDGRVDGPVGFDGIPDSVQDAPNGGTVNYTPRDTDGDGRPDYVDLDSDNDGINDVRESGGTDSNGDGKADGAVDGNGIPGTSSPGGATPRDTDGDGVPDYRDLDSDNDGIPDVVENGGSDPDHNGIVGTGPIPTDTDGDGIPNVVDNVPGGFGELADPPAVDTDGDGVPNYRDLDSDNDGTGDVIEGGHGGSDANGDGTISGLESPDTDGDGIPDLVDHSPVFGDAGGAAPPDTDTDGTPDYVDTDSDGDGITDLIEGGHDPALDPDHDGRIDTPVDPDGDGVPNNGGNDTIPGGFGGTTPPVVPLDTDGDGVPNVVDLDADNDGIPDTVEIANAINGGDTDGDGIPDYLDLDSDNDGIPDVIEAGHAGLDADHDGRVDGPYGVNGLADSVETTPGSGVINYTPRDTDGDGRPDYLDLDSDNDSISDLLESGNGSVVDADHDGLADGSSDANGLPSGLFVTTDPVDSDSDGTPDYRDLDSNGDGVNDIVDNGFSGLDADHDGRIDNDSDGDQDGIANPLDSELGTFGGFPLVGCQAWFINNDTPSDEDGDVFPMEQEYAFGGSMAAGDHLVEGTSRREGLSTVKRSDGDVDVSFVRPQGRYDVTYTLYGSTDLASWTAISTLPTVTPNGDGTDTLIWEKANLLSGVSADRGFVRLSVSTPCHPAESFTLVQGWSRETVAGSRQTYGVNFTSMPVFSGLADDVSGTLLTTQTSGADTDLGALVSEPGAVYYVEFTDGAGVGQRFDISGGVPGVFGLNLGSANNTSSTLPPGLAGSHFVVRKHRTLGEIFTNSEWNAANSSGSADQVQFYNGHGFDIAFNFQLGGYWAGSSSFADLTNRVIRPGEAVYAIHASGADSNSLLQVGDVRYNDFVRPLVKGTTGLNFVAQGYPLDASPDSLDMTPDNQFTAAASSGSATQIQLWKGDKTLNSSGFTLHFLFTTGAWYRTTDFFDITSEDVMEHDRGVFLNVKQDNPDWLHPLPWNPGPWVQP